MSDHEGWDNERDGNMDDFAEESVDFDVEDYNPDKDPVNKGLVPNPYGG